MVSLPQDRWRSLTALWDKGNSKTERQMTQRGSSPTPTTLIKWGIHNKYDTCYISKATETSSWQPSSQYCDSACGGLIHLTKLATSKTLAIYAFEQTQFKASTNYM